VLILNGLGGNREWSGNSGRMAAIRGREKSGRESDTTLRGSGLVYTKEHSRKCPTCQLLYWYHSNDCGLRDTGGCKLPDSRGLREGCDSKELWKCVQKSKAPHAKPACGPPARSGRKGRRSSLGWVGVSSMAAGLRASQDPSRHVGRGSEKQIPRSARDDTGRRGE
jgi:hypothetical protein